MQQSRVKRSYQTAHCAAALACVLALHGALVDTSAIAVETAADATVLKLIDDLASAEPTVREAATAALRKQGAAVRTQLTRAKESPRVAIADAASALLAELPLSMPGDSVKVRVLLQDYGVQPPEVRFTKLKLLIDDPAVPRETILRVLDAENDNQVAWFIYTDALQSPPQPQWTNVLKTMDLASASPPIRLLASYVLRATDAAESMRWARSALDDELASPTVSMSVISRVVDDVIDLDLSDKDFVSALRRLRGLSSVVSVPADEREANIRAYFAGRLYGLHLRHGPFAGWATDLSGPSAAPERQSLARAALSAKWGSRLSMGVACEALLGRELRTVVDELPVVRATRLVESGRFLNTSGQSRLAIAVLSACAEIDDPSANIPAANASLVLYDLYRRTRAFDLAGQSLQAALDRFGNDAGLSHTTPSGRSRPWPAEDARAAVEFCFYRHAEQQNDAPAMEASVRKIFNTGTSDADIFLEILPTSERVLKPQELDTFFDRTYAAQQAELADAPDDAHTLNASAWLGARSGRRVDEAMIHAERAVKMRPNEAAFLDTLAEAKFRKGLFQDAIALEEKALRLMPDETFMHEQLARFKAAAATQPGR